MKKIIIVTISIILVAWALWSAFIVDPDLYYSSITRGRFIGLLSVLALIITGVYIYTCIKAYKRTKNIALALKEGCKEILSWLKAFISTDKE